MQVTLHRTNGNRASRFNVGLNQVGFQQSQARLHCPSSNQHFGYKIFAFLEEAADFSHGIYHAIVQDVTWGKASIDGGLHPRNRFFLLSIQNTIVNLFNFLIHLSFSFVGKTFFFKYIAWTTG